jgi:hypothetical protein
VGYDAVYFGRYVLLLRCDAVQLDRQEHHLEYDTLQFARQIRLMVYEDLQFGNYDAVYFGREKSVLTWRDVLGFRRFIRLLGCTS